MSLPAARDLLLVAGLGQLVLALASLAIPRALGWRADTARLQPLTRHVFWTYAGYIWVTNVSFGLLSVLAPYALLDGSLLARCVGAFIAVYWGARLLIQLFYFGKLRPAGAAFRFAEAGLLALFTYLTAVYAYVAAR